MYSTFRISSVAQRRGVKPFLVSWVHRLGHHLLRCSKNYKPHVLVNSENTGLQTKQRRLANCRGFTPRFTYEDTCFSQSLHIRVIVDFATLNCSATSLCDISASSSSVSFQALIHSFSVFP